jgi:hypothetical protein
VPNATLHLTDWAAIAGIAAAIGTLVTLGFVIRQLKLGNKDLQAQVRAQRSTATMLFQERFKESERARRHVFMEFPLHDSLFETMCKLRPDAPPDPRLATWATCEELTKEQKAVAKTVINACNDVAQYVVDGLELRSALQQYHLPLLRVGTLLNPYLLEINAERDGQKGLRTGRRIPILYNAALAYHRCNRKHKGRPVDLQRPGPGESETVSLCFLDADGIGIEQFKCFPDTPEESLLLPDDRLSSVITAAEEMLRR